MVCQLFSYFHVTVKVKVLHSFLKQQRDCCTSSAKSSYISYSIKSLIFSLINDWCDLKAISSSQKYSVIIESITQTNSFNILVLQQIRRKNRILVWLMNVYLQVCLPVLSGLAIRIISLKWSLYGTQNVRNQ